MTVHRNALLSTFVAVIAVYALTIINAAEYEYEYEEYESTKDKLDSGSGIAEYEDGEYLDAYNEYEAYIEEYENCENCGKAVSLDIHPIFDGFDPDATWVPTSSPTVPTASPTTSPTAYPTSFPTQFPTRGTLAPTVPTIIEYEYEYEYEPNDDSTDGEEYTFDDTDTKTLDEILEEIKPTPPPTHPPTKKNENGNGDFTLPPTPPTTLKPSPDDSEDPSSSSGMGGTIGMVGAGVVVLAIAGFIFARKKSSNNADGAAQRRGPQDHNYDMEKNSFRPKGSSNKSSKSSAFNNNEGGSRFSVV